MGSSTKLFSGERREPSFDEVDPRCTCRREVHVEARTLREPTPDRRRLVGCVVIHHEMDIEMLGDLLVDRVQELLELERSMASMTFADHFSGRDVECSEQGRCSVPNIVVGLAFRIPRSHGEKRLCSIESLDL